MSNILTADGLVRRFGGLLAADDLSFAVQAGEILGIIGPNGAGKTTAVNLVSGVIRPQAGRVSFNGGDVTGMPPHALLRKGLARTFQSTTVYRDQSVAENALRGAFLHLYPGFWASLLGTRLARTRRAAAERRVDELLGWFGLEALAGSRAGDLPYGKQKVLGMVIALMSGPKLIMLDEPVAGLGGEDANGVRDAVRRIRNEGITVVVIDHNMKFISDLCDRVLVLQQGRQLAMGTPKQVLSDPTVIEAYLGKRHAAAHGH